MWELCVLIPCGTDTDVQPTHVDGKGQKESMLSKQ